jgi:hypothetical protein
MQRAFVSLIVGALLLVPARGTGAQNLPLLLQSWPVALSDALSDGAAIGRLRPRGMLQLPALRVDNLRFSQLSGLAWDDDDGILYAISDKGYLFHLRPVFKNGILTGVTLLKAVVLTETNGKAVRGLRADSEGLEILRGRNGVKGDAELLIGFERSPRIVRYRTDGKALGELTLPAPLNDSKAYRDPNEMLEALCVDPALGVLTTPEYPLKDAPDGTTTIFALDGRRWRYATTAGFGISALECLGENRVLVLERSFGRLFGRNAIAFKLATLPAKPSPETPVKAAEIATLDVSAGHQIDNFEGLARHKGNRFFAVSDDNDLFVQRTLLLYFELLPE